MINSPDIAPYSDHTENNSKYVAEVRSSAAAWATYMVDDIAYIDQWPAFAPVTSLCSLKVERDRANIA